MRLFTAINFNEDIKSNLLKVINDLKKESEKGNFTRKENLHLTLVFIGEMPLSKVNDIKSAMDKSVKENFNLDISNFGKFKRGEESLYWCGCEKEKRLMNLQRDLCNNLKEAKISFDVKPFKPHITLGRRCIMKSGFSEEEFKNNIPKMSMNADKISLMKSERIDGKMVYTEIYGVDLK